MNNMYTFWNSTIKKRHSIEFKQMRDTGVFYPEAIVKKHCDSVYIAEFPLVC